MKLLFIIYLLLVCQFVSASESAESEMVNSIVNLENKKWIHGSIDCKKNDDPGIEVYQYNATSYILRQSKCLSFEAPFIYVLIGDEKTLVLDTGATEDAKVFPLYKTIKGLQEKHSASIDNEMLVLHSHSHSDHYTGDEQFKGKANVTVIGTDKKNVESYFSFDDKPTQPFVMSLGGREITVLFTPGHQEQAISIYDAQTQWLLTGDSFYPGYVYVKDWDQYTNSINYLSSFVREHQVSAILGAHIEMKNEPRKYYDIGTIYQPNEAPLPLSVNTLLELDAALQKTSKSKKIVFDSLIVEPMPAVAKVLSNIFSLF